MFNLINGYTQKIFKVKSAAFVMAAMMLAVMILAACGSDSAIF